MVQGNGWRSSWHDLWHQKPAGSCLGRSHDSSPRDQALPSLGWGTKVGEVEMGKKVRWKATAIMERHQAGVSPVLPDPCVLPYMLRALCVMNHLPHM